MESSSHVRNRISIAVNPQKQLAEFCRRCRPTLVHFDCETQLSRNKSSNKANQVFGSMFRRNGSGS
ncbi:conserved hypothetical protein, partial [Trichinella spiralis]|uniref:hypothetical protein n=1 Tax=Trichinella spiralis TaxID=6334 RepID=UPI0001EFD20A